MVNEVKMFDVVKIGCLFALLLLNGCKDVLNRPLSGIDRPGSVDTLEGRWRAESREEQLDIAKTSKPDWYQFRWQQKDKLTEGRFALAYFKSKWVFNIDLASVRIDGAAVVDTSQTAFLLVGAKLDDDALLLTPADMEKFEKHFSQYFFASPISVSNLCVNKNDACMSVFSAGNVLMSKRMKKFNDDFIKHYRSVFPSKKQLLYIR